MANVHRLEEIKDMMKNYPNLQGKIEKQGMVKQNQINSQFIKPSGHNSADEDIAKVASAEIIGKSDSTENLRK